nr:hypothetical protein GCM10020093_032600 [Planobispora longispora]
MVISGDEGRVETFDTGTGKRLSSVVPSFPGDEFLNVGLGWSKRGSFMVEALYSERTYFLDLATGELRRREK